MTETRIFSLNHCASIDIYDSPPRYVLSKCSTEIITRLWTLLCSCLCVHVVAWRILLSRSKYREKEAELTAFSSPIPRLGILETIWRVNLTATSSSAVLFKTCEKF
ncbi:hypothetical protein F2Q68_00003897 [Brassica cretica]|uniref:Uncharacterized protein n=1 Tax=Brassica cretica TaxID=69181 RepID=A0A8S9JD48_BRACR|nr:hypothetical protein F2Q68_00003897 [Brassica cretica]